jgi:hypothetical protein
MQLKKGVRVCSNLLENMPDMLQAAAALSLLQYERGLKMTAKQLCYDYFWFCALPLALLAFCLKKERKRDYVMTKRGPL